MQSVHVLVASNNPATAAKLAASLKPHFPSVLIRGSLEEARSAISGKRTRIVVLDLETVSLDQVQQLCREYTGISFICTHRLADEQMWTAALNAGATDCCYDGDVAGILRAAGAAAAPISRTAAA